MQNNLFIAITGGIGSGKSKVLRYIQSLNYKVIDLDEVYAKLLDDTQFLSGICDITGVPPILRNDGSLELNRREVSEKVFNEPETLRLLNEYTHPKIIQEAKSEALAAGGTVFCEVPLLYESHLENLFDYVIVIMRSESERIRAVEKRSGLTAAEIEKRIKNQFDYANLTLNEHTIVIENDGDVSELYAKVEFEIKKIIG